MKVTKTESFAWHRYALLGAAKYQITMLVSLHYVFFSLATHFKDYSEGRESIETEDAPLKKIRKTGILVLFRRKL